MRRAAPSGLGHGSASSVAASAAGVSSRECHALCAAYVGADAVVPRKVKV